MAVVTGGESVDVVVVGPAPSAPVVAHHQIVPAATWTVLHDLEGKPDINLFEDSEPLVPVFTDVSHPEPGVIVVEWPEPTTGWAYVR